MQQGPRAAGRDGHRRNRRRRQGHAQHLDRDRYRRGRRRRGGGQARQPQSQFQIRRGGCAQPAGPQRDGRRGRGRAGALGGRHRLHDGADASPRDGACRPGARGTGHPHDLQHPRAADQPGRRQAATHRGILARSDPAHGRDAGPVGQRARMAGTWLRRHRRDDDHRPHMGRRAGGRRQHPRGRTAPRGFRLARASVRGHPRWHTRGERPRASGAARRRTRCLSRRGSAQCLGRTHRRGPRARSARRRRHGRRKHRLRGRARENHRSGETHIGGRMTTPTILDKIKTYKLEEIAAAKAARPQDEIEAEAGDAPAVRPFADALLQATKTGYGLIAGIKKASPSKGLIREDFDPAALAEAYASGGATCLSVLTDTPSFQGAPEYLGQARAAGDLPVLRKDFMYDPYQVAEARAWGADCILIIMASVSDAQAAELEEAATRWGMDALIEVHNREELDRANALKSNVIGINNRDLNTFETSLDTTRKLAKFVDPDGLIVSESGLSTPEDLAEMARYGARSFLIGETLMRAEDVAQATRALLANPMTAGGI